MTLNSRTVTVDDGGVVRVFRRRLSRKVKVLLAAAAVCGLLGLVAWWRPAGVRMLRFGWDGIEQAGWIAGILGAVLAVASFIFDRLAARREHAPRWSPTDELVQIGRIPQAASWFQHRALSDRLAEAAQTGRTAVLTQVLSGMGGVGKTQLAAQFARQIIGELDLLVWVTASSRDAIVAAYAETAVAIRVADVDVEPESAAGRLLGWLERTEQRWLIVLDNLDRPADAAGWWPPANPHGRTIVTTRRRDAALHADGRSLLDVEQFTPEEAVTYLAHALDSASPSEDLHALVEDLGYLPLALAQAAAYIRERRIRFATYRQRLTDRRRRLADLLPAGDALPDDHRTTVAATWALSVDAADLGPPRSLARPVLAIAALLDPNTIPAELFASVAIRRFLTTDPAAPAASHAVTDALHTLHRFNLLTHEPDRESVRIHALVQRVTRDQFSSSQASSAAHAAANALLDVWPGIERLPAYSQILRANATALRYHTGDTLLTPRVHAVLFRDARSLGESGLIQQAKATFQQMLDDCLRVLGSDHPDTLNVRHHLAYWCGRAGDPVNAARAFEQLLDDRLRILGPDHPDTLDTRHNLAYWRGLAGDPTGAATALQRLLDDRLRILGPDHPDTLSTRHYLAHWRGDAGDPASAAAAFEHLLDDRLRVLGPDHPDTMDTRSYLARWRGEAGDAASAVTAIERLLDDRLRVLGPDHPDTMDTRHSFAYWVGVAGDPARAATAFERLLDDTLRVLGPDHPDTLTTRHNLAYWRGETGDPASAAAALEHLLDDCLRVLGPDHPNTLSTRHNIACCHGDAGNPFRAATALERLLTDRLRVLGPDHPDTLKTRHQLANYRGRDGDPAGAATALEQLLDASLRVLGPNHPETLNMRRSLTRWRGEVDEPSE